MTNSLMCIHRFLGLNRLLGMLLADNLLIALSRNIGDWNGRGSERICGVAIDFLSYTEC